MRLLLDTHAFLWANQAPERLGPWRSVVADEANELLLSAASSWELAIKVALGRLDLPEPVVTFVPSRMATLGVTALPIEHRHALAVSNLAPHHRDPFDRLLIAQSTLLGVPILTADNAFDPYDVETYKIAPA